MTLVSLELMNEDPKSQDFLFHSRIGRAIMQWGQVEAALCLFFSHFGQMPPKVARRIFYAVDGFRPRSNLLKAVLTTSPSTEPAEVVDFLKSILGRAQTYSGSRNMIAHGDVVTIRDPGSPYNDQTIIIQGREIWRADMPREEVITSDDLQTACANFTLLGTLLFGVLNWRDPNQHPSPKELQQLACLLPNPAHRTRLAPSILELFAKLPSVQAAWR